MTDVADALAGLGDAAKGKAHVVALAAHLERAGITVEEIGRVSRISMWQTVTKNADGEAETHDLHGFRLAPSWDEGPKWPMMAPGPRVQVSAPKVGKRTAESKSATTTVVLPDMQCGYYRDHAGELQPIHDTAAIDVALAIIQAAAPSRVVLLGDNLDLPEMSRYRLSPAFQQTTQAAVDYMAVLAGRLRAAAGPDAEIVWLAGNHEERLSNWIVDNARAAFGLRQGDRPESWPVLSVPHLCRLDDHGITYKPGYPASDIWITPNLRIIHGDRVKSRGSTAHVYLDQQKTSVIYGHIHRIERAHRTRHDFDGPSEIMAASPGCLARIDGVVPSTGQGLDLDGRPLPRVEDWQTGLAVVTVDGDAFDYEQVRIDPATHTAWWRGQRYTA